MSILSQNNYKELNPNASLEEYIDYLERSQRDLEEAMEIASSLDLDKGIVEDLQKKMDEIVNIATILIKNQDKIIINSIELLTIEELQEYFQSEKESLSKEKQKLLNSKNKLQAELQRTTNEFQKHLHLCQKQEEEFRQNNTKIFFQPIDSTTKMVTSFMYDSYNRDELFNNFKNAILQESKIQQKFISEERASELSEEILSLIEKYRMIAKQMSSRDENLAKKLLSQEGKLTIFSILPEEFDYQTCHYLIIDILCKEKRKTDFYQHLSPNTQKQLVEERFQGEKYKELYLLYQKVQRGESLLEDLIPKDIQQEKSAIKEQIESVDKLLVTIEAEEETISQLLGNKQEMQENLKRKFSSMMQIESTEELIKRIEQALEKSEQLSADFQQKLKNTVIEIENMMKDIEEANQILSNSYYQNYFEQEEIRTTKLLLKTLGISATEMVTEPYLDVEEKRLIQFETIINIQRELSKIQQTYQTLEPERKHYLRNFIKSKAYQEKMETLKKHYQQIVNDGFNKLKEQNCLNVLAPTIDILKSKKGHIVTVPQNVKVPQNFDDLANVAENQTFMDLIHSSFLSNMEGEFCKEDDWSHVIEDAQNTQISLTFKLFDFKKDEEGFYKFSITDEEAKKLLEVQTFIIKILKKDYEIRSQFTQMANQRTIILEWEKEKEFEKKFGGEFRKETLENFILEMSKKIELLWLFLLKNKDECHKLNIEIPEEILKKEESLVEDTEKSRLVNQPFLDLNIEGIKTIEDAKKYREVLLEMKKFKVSPEQITKMYQSFKEFKGENAPTNKMV